MSERYLDNYENTETSSQNTNVENTVDSFLNKILSQIEDPQKKTDIKTWMDEFLKDENLKKGFEDFLKYAQLGHQLGHIMDAEDKLLECENQDDVRKFIEEHQGVRVASITVNSGMSELEGQVQASDEQVQANGEQAKKINVTATETVAKTEGERVTMEGERVTMEGERVTMEGERVTMEGERVTMEGERVTMEKRGNQLDSIKMEVNKLLEIRKDILKDYPKLEKDTRDRADQLNQQLPEATRNQLKERGYDDDFIYNYILLRVTVNEIKNDSRFDADVVKNFDNAVNRLSAMDIFLKNIDNECKIADTTLDSFSSENIANTRRELFNKDVGNKKLIEARENNKKSHGEAYEKLFSEKISDEELINKYGGLLLQDPDIPPEYQNSLNFFKNDYLVNQNTRDDINNMRNTSQADEIYKDNPLYINYKNMISALEREKGKVEDKTKDMIEEMCLITQVNGMAKCIGQENFTFNKAKEIKIDENDNMVLNGHIDGVDFSVRHNTKQEWSPLQLSSKLIKSEDGKSFEIGNEGNQKFESSPYALPGQSGIFNMITDIVSTSVKSTERIETIDTYIENMQKNITGEVEKVYADTNDAHDYMQNKVKGEKAISNGIELIENADTNIDFSKPIDNNSILYPFMKILNFNIERSTPTEKDKLNDCVTKILEITKDYEKKGGKDEFGAHKYPSVIDNYLKNPAWLNKTDRNARLGCISELFKYYSSSEESSDVSRFSPQGSDSFPTRIIVNNLHRDLFEAEKDNPTTRSPVAKGFKDEGFIADIDNGNFWENGNDGENDGVTYGINQKIDNVESVA